MRSFTLTGLRYPALTFILLLLLAHPADLSSCGPFAPQPIFTNTLRPDGPSFGILQPTYKRYYLVQAYRAMTGRVLTRVQTESLDSYQRIGPDAQASLNSWLDARKQIPGISAVTVQLYRSGPNYQMIPSCLAGAFDNARQTLSRYVSNFGPSSPETKEWLAAQDAVFVNCGDASALPDAPKSNATPDVGADRAYQIAAACFYSAKYEQARTAFENIAADKSSRWHLLAPYLVALVDLRQNRFEAAVAKLNAILADPSESAMHPSARSLLEYASARFDPAARLTVLGQRLVETNSTSFAQDLDDYTFLYDQLEDAASAEKLPNLAAQDELTNWIFTFQKGSGDSSLQHWKSSQSQPWLIAALHQVTAKYAAATELIDAANKIPENSPAFPTAQFESIRLTIESGQTKEAATQLEPLLKKSATFDPSTANAFHAERLKIAESFDVFLENAPRISQNEDDTKKTTIAFDADATRIFNQSLPQSLWRDALNDPKLDLSLRTALEKAHRVRAILLNTGAPNFDAIFWLLHHAESQPSVRTGEFTRSTPDGRIDNFRDNWWCAPTSAGETELTGLLPRLYPPDHLPQAAFLNAAQKYAADQEQRQLQAAGSAPRFLAAAVLHWANSHPGDPRNAEALALAVKTSRFGCPDKNSTPSIHAAFNLLHTRYRQTLWAKRTPYWY